MDFQLTEDQRALAAGMRELLSGLFPRERLRQAVGGPGGAPALDRALWRELGRAGFFALRLPEADGGVGLGLPEAVLLFEEAGRALLPGPLVATHLAAGCVEGAATGETVVTAVDGELVAWFGAADHVMGRYEAVEPIPSVDPLTPLHRVYGGTPWPPGRETAGPDTVAALPPAAPRTTSLPTASLPTASLLTAAQQAGSAARTVELAVQHARRREQFGRPIGAFQAVKHLCAEMLVRAEMARTAVYAAAVTQDPYETAAARLLADDAAVRNARDCLQVFGGMGFTWEADVHLHIKRSWVLAASRADAERDEESLAVQLLG